MKILVGLGNPGASYEFTRHNVGFRVIDHLCFAWHVPLKKKDSWESQVGSCKKFDEPVLLVKPHTFMNNSGWALRQILDYHGVAPKDLIVVSDEVSLDLGTLRLRSGGSGGGHNGLLSIIEELGTNEFPRLRVGIRSAALASKDLTPFVLGEFGAQEEKVVCESIARAGEILQVVVEQGLHKAMNLCNPKG